jgi:hypothetical protein
VLTPGNMEAVTQSHLMPLDIIRHRRRAGGFEGTNSTAASKPEE